MEQKDFKEGELYFCKFTEQIFKYIGWFELGNCPFIVNPFNPAFMQGQQRRTWAAKHLIPATKEHINTYRNYLCNSHQIDSDCSFVVHEDDFIGIHGHDESVIIKKEAFEKMVSIYKEGFIKKWESYD